MPEALRGERNSKLAQGNKIGSPLINYISPITTTTHLQSDDVTLIINGILGSLERAYEVIEDRCDRISDQAISLSEQLFPGSKRLLKNLSASSRFGISGAQAGFSKPGLIFAIGMGALSTFALSSFFSVSVATAAGVLFGVGGFLGTLIALDMIKNPTRRYIFVKQLYPLAVSLLAAGVRFWMRYEHLDNWYCQAAMVAVAGLGFTLPSITFYINEHFRHHFLNKQHSAEISEMIETASMLKLINQEGYKKNPDLNRLEKKVTDSKYKSRSTRNFHVMVKTELLARIDALRETASDAKVIETLRIDYQRALNQMTRNVPIYRFPQFLLNPIFEGSRTASLLLYVPLSALLFSQGYDLFTSLIFTMFWFSQLIYGPTGRGFMRNLLVGNFCEPAQYHDLPTKGGVLAEDAFVGFGKKALQIWPILVETGNVKKAQVQTEFDPTKRHDFVEKFLSKARDLGYEFSHTEADRVFGIVLRARQSGDPYEKLIPKARLLRLSNTGLFREGRIPIFLIRDILNCIATGYRVQVVLNNDPKNLFYPEVVGAVARANQIAARVYTIHQFIINRGELKKLPFEKKKLLLRIFMKENLWDATQEFDHAMNGATSGSWPNQIPNMIFTSHGDEAGDKTCGKALRRMLRQQAKEQKDPVVAKAFREAARVIRGYASGETRISLYNIFDNEYMKLACGEIAERVARKVKTYQDPEKDLSTDLFQVISENREQALIKEYYRLARRKSWGWKAFGERQNYKARLYEIASDLVHRLKREIKIAQAAPLADRLVAQDPTLRIGQRRELTSLICEITGISKRDAGHLLKRIRKLKLDEFSAYLAQMPSVPREFFEEIRDTTLLALAYERRSMDGEDSNLLPWYIRMATTPVLGPDGKRVMTPGQRALWERIKRVVTASKLDEWLKPFDIEDDSRAGIVKDYQAGKIRLESLYVSYPELQAVIKDELPSAVHAWLMDLNYAVAKDPDNRVPAYSNARVLAQQIESNFRMQRIVFDRKRTGTFLALNIGRYLPYILLRPILPIPILGTKLIRGLLKSRIFEALIGFPTGRTERGVKWCLDLAHEIALEVSRSQLFSRDYGLRAEEMGIEKISRISRDTMEERVFDDWTETKSHLRKITNRVVEVFLEKELLKNRRLGSISPAAAEMIKYQIYKMTEEQLDKARNQVLSTATGIAILLTQENEGIIRAAQEARNPDSRLAMTLAETIPQKEESVFNINEYSLDKYSVLPIAENERSFLEDLPNNLALLAKVRKQLQAQLVSQVMNARKADKADAQRVADVLEKDLRGLMETGVGSNPKTKGYVKERLSLCREVPDVVLGRAPLEFRYRRRWLISEGSLRIAPSSIEDAKSKIRSQGIIWKKDQAEIAKLRTRIEEIKSVATLEIRDTLELIAAIESKAVALRYEIKTALYATLRPEEGAGRAMEDFATDVYATKIMEKALAGEVTNVEEAALFLEEQGSELVREAIMPELNNLGDFRFLDDNNVGNILGPTLEALISKANDLVQTGALGTFRRRGG